MERFDNQRWTSKEVARLIAVFESERRFYDEIVTSLPVPLATAGPDGALLSANPAFLRRFNLASTDVDKAHLATLLPGQPWAEQLQPYAPGRLDLPDCRVDFTPIPRWDRGEREWIVTFTAPPAATPAPAPPVHPSPPAHDTDLAANAAAIDAAQRLAARVTHEANNLIMIAAGYGREILTQLPEGSPLREDMEALLSATGRIEAMAAQLNEYSRKERAQIAAHPLSALLPASGYTLANPAPGVSVDTDPAALAALFHSLPLVTNQTLTIATTLSAQEAVITVRGFGMSEDNLRQQFEVLNKAAREGRAGARECVLAAPRLVQAGVRWRVTPDATLELRLPLAAARKTAAAPAVLVVDDQPGIRTIVRRILEGRGYQVTEAGSGEEAVSVLDRRNAAFDLLVTDMRMPGMTGRDLAERVRFRYPDTRILFISGFTDDPGVQSGILPDRARFLSKPFNPDQLLDAIDQLMR